MSIQGLSTKGSRGFTLTELLISMALAGVVMGGIYTVHRSQQKSYMIQEQVVAMQQSLRAAMDLMEREIRMAGFDPYRNSGAGILAPTAVNSLRFCFVADDDAYDNDGDGDVDEAGELKTIRYALYDSGADGDSDLGRKVGAGTNKPVAENIDALDFVFLREDGTPTANVSEVRSIQITLVAKSGRSDPRYLDTVVYTNQQGSPILGPKNDNFRRRRLTAEICCRNLAF
jgi:type IV pilus assembly protein PilW